MAIKWNYRQFGIFQRQPSINGLLMTKNDTEIFLRERENLSGYKRPSSCLSFQVWSIESNH
jgi:hypothetical protein